jgi:3'-phosphoadenosine 5'-phosphosulfate sulfotransferase (PAPS reductase)/FAD synthetase
MQHNPRSIHEYAFGFFRESMREFQDQPIHLALSGGRSSAAMLALILEHHQWKLPANYQIVFCNTGKEDAGTLDFIKAIEQNWNVPIIWLEMTAVIAKERVSYQQVSYETAARQGEPFLALMRDKADYPPRRSARTCTEFLKVLTAEAFLKEELGWKKWDHLLGYREDERGRLQKALMRCGKKQSPSRPHAPLINAGIDRKAVLAYWRESPFDLNIPEGCGNCDLCFLKPLKLLARNIQAMPSRADFWIGIDQPVGRNWHMLPNGGYAALKERALSSDEIDEIDASDLECHCTD